MKKKAKDKQKSKQLKIIALREERKKKMIHHDPRITILFFLEGLSCFLFQQYLIGHFHYEIGFLPEYLVNVVCCIAFVVFGLFGLMISWLSEAPYKEDGKLDSDIMREGECFTKYCLDIILLVFPFLYFFAHIILSVYIFLLGVCITLFIDFRYGYEKSFGFGMIKNIKPKQLIHVELRTSSLRTSMKIPLWLVIIVCLAILILIGFLGLLDLQKIW